MDVCLMPFPLSGITRNGDAIKLYEYLAAGKPVVSVPVPAALRNRDVVRIASTKEEFVSAIEDSLRDREDARDRRIAAVKTQTWSHRVEQKLELVERALQPSGRRSSPRVSIILPAYNAEAFLPQSIGSALGQSFRDFELLVLDNASTDNTPEIVTRYSDPRIRFVRHDRNHGFGGNVARGIALARGEYVAVLGADDLWSPGFLEKTVGFLDTHPRVGIVHTDAIWIDAEGRPFGESAAGWREITPPAEAVVDCFRRGFCFAAVMWRAPVLEQAGGFDENWGFAADLPLFLRLCLQGDTGFIPENLVWYRHHPQNLSTAMFRGMGGGMLAMTAEAFATVLRWPAAQTVITPRVRRLARRNMAAVVIHMLHLTRLEGQRMLWLRNFGKALRFAPLLALRPYTWACFALGLLPRNAILALQRRRHNRAGKRYAGAAPDERSLAARVSG
jgi:glycosyltransferase involved in cell wall biosynthesis